MTGWQVVVAVCACVGLGGGFVMLLGLGECAWRGIDRRRERREARRPVCAYRAMRPDEVFPGAGRR
jgi:hypothetical protein